MAAGESGASVSTAMGSITARGSPTTCRASSRAWVRVHGGVSSRRRSGEVEVVDDLGRELLEVLDEGGGGVGVARDAEAAQHELAELVDGRDGGRVEGRPARPSAAAAARASSARVAVSSQSCSRLPGSRDAGSRRTCTASSSWARTRSRSSWLAARVKVTTSISSRATLPSATCLVTSAAIVQVLPVPALASSRVMPGSRSRVMSKVSITDAPDLFVARGVRADQRTPQPPGEVPEPVRRRAVLARAQRPRQQVVVGVRTEGPLVPHVGVLLGEARVVEPRRDPLRPATGIRVAVAAALGAAELLGPGQRRLDRQGQGLAQAGLVERDEVAQPRARVVLGQRPDHRDLATGAVLADGVRGPVLVGPARRQGERVEPGGQPVLGAEVGEGDGDEVVAEDVADGAGDPPIAQVDVDVEGADRAAPAGSSALSTSGRTLVMMPSRTPLPSAPGGSCPPALSARSTAARVGTAEHRRGQDGRRPPTARGRRG